ncbi:alpha/beta hydrolase [Candidatus Micrarchaeota archaeon]|nr:alpha/beta hydrolase [Candidatus Micrarchaeota archaeon]
MALKPRSHFVEVLSGEPLHVLEAGNLKGPAVLFVHGFGGSGQGWVSQMDYLRRRGFHVLAPDLAGHGDSPYASRHSVADYARDMEAVLDHFKVKAVHVVAHSYGSPIALELARKRPDEVKSLVVVNGFRSHPAYLKFRVRVGLWLRQIAGGTAGAQKVIFSEALVPKVPLALLDRARNVLQDRIAFETRNYVYEDSKMADAELQVAPVAEPNALINLFNATSRYVPPANLDVPITAIHSLNDRIIPYGSALQFQRYSRAQVLGLDSKSHVLHRERQKEVNRAILESIIGQPPREFWQRRS